MTFGVGWWAFYGFVQSVPAIDVFPDWVEKLAFRCQQRLLTPVTIERLSVNDPDYAENAGVYRIKGEGELRKVPDPFVILHGIFASKDWHPDARQLADGHGSSSFVYTGSGRSCRIFIWTDSACENDAIGHHPTLFWFAVDCRESVSHESAPTPP
ncbi:MAG: hypothetical protein R6U50_07860 [Desulfobacterales bacterium]